MVLCVNKILASLMIAITLIGCKSTLNKASSSTAERSTTTAATKPTATTQPHAATTEGTSVSPSAATAPVSAQTASTPTTPQTNPASADDGTHAHPFTPAELTKFGDFAPFTIGTLALADTAVIEAASPVNSVPPAGMAWVKVPIAATYTGADNANGYTIQLQTDLVGDKSTLYQPAFLAEVTGELDVSQQVIAGGTIAGDDYFLIPTDDTNFLLVLNDIIHDAIYVDVTP